jgi:hypothetical protein
MRASYLPLAVGLLVLPLAGVASAQVCNGAADISRNAKFAGGGFIETQSYGHSRDFDGVLVGGSDGYFSEADIGGEFVGSPNTAAVFTSSLLVGGQIAAAPSRRVVICPVGGFSTAYSPDYFGANLFGLTFGGGFGIGGVIVDHAGFEVIPAGGVLVQRVRARLSEGGAAAVAWANATTTEIGVGVVFQHRFTIKPAVLFYTTLGATHAAFRLTFLARVSGR